MNKGSPKRLEREAFHAGGQPTRRSVRRVVVRHVVSQIPREVFARSMATGGSQASRISHQCRARHGRRLDERSHDTQDLGPVHDHQSSRSDQVARAQCAVRAGCACARRRHGVWYHQDRLVCTQPREVRQETSTAHWSKRVHFKSNRAAYRLLYACTGKHCFRSWTL